MTIKINKKKKKGSAKERAGIIILKDFYDEYKVLCLRIFGSYDLPKGGVEPFENIFAAATREAEEESSITELDFKWGLVTTRTRNVTLYIAVTTQDPAVKPNPETGAYEHHDAVWKTIDDAEKSLHPYLRPTMSWARTIIEKG